MVANTWRSTARYQYAKHQRTGRSMLTKCDPKKSYAWKNLENHLTRCRPIETQAEKASAAFHGRSTVAGKRQAVKTELHAALGICSVSVSYATADLQILLRTTDALDLWITPANHRIVASDTDFRIRPDHDSGSRNHYLVYESIPAEVTVSTILSTPHVHTPAWPSFAIRFHSV